MGQEKTGMTTNWSSVLNLANSIIGVGILALPLCVKSVGYLLGTLTLLVCGYITIRTSNLLVISATTVKASSYEQLAMRAFGVKGKMICEIGITGMLYGVLVAFHGVIGDSSGMLAELLGIENTSSWRFTVQLIALVTIELPFSLLRNISSLNALSAVSICIYTSFTVFLFEDGVGEWLLASTSNGVPMVNMAGLLKSFPIIALAFNCQTTLLPLFNELPNPTVKRMNKVSTYAIGFVGSLYLIIGISGTLAFGEALDGNVLNNFPVTPLIIMFKVGFLVCIALSFPLVVFPTRISINSLYLGDGGDPTHMSDSLFRSITTLLIFTSLLISVIFPKVDTILAVSGATAGCLIGFIYPGLIFLKCSDTREQGRGFAKFLLVVGVVTTIAGLSNILLVKEHHHGLNPKHIINIKPDVVIEVPRPIHLNLPELPGVVSDEESVQPVQQPAAQDLTIQHVEQQPPPATDSKLNHGKIVEMLEKLQVELQETKKELRAEKQIRIENEIKGLKEQLKGLQLEEDKAKVEEKVEVKIKKEEKVEQVEEKVEEKFKQVEDKVEEKKQVEEKVEEKKEELKKLKEEQDQNEEIHVVVKEVVEPLKGEDKVEHVAEQKKEETQEKGDTGSEVNKDEAVKNDNSAHEI